MSATHPATHLANSLSPIQDDYFSADSRLSTIFKNPRKFYYAYAHRPLKNYFCLYQETVTQILPHPKITNLLKAQALISLEYFAIATLAWRIDYHLAGLVSGLPFSPLVYWPAYLALSLPVSLIAMARFHPRNSLIKLTAPTYLSPENSDILDRPSSEKTPLKDLITLNLTQPLVLWAFGWLSEKSIKYILPLFFNHSPFFNLASSIFSFGFLALSRGFILWQYAFTRDGFTPEQTVKTLSHYPLKTMLLGLLPALIETVLGMMSEADPVIAIAATAFFLPLLTFLTTCHAFKKSAAADKIILKKFPQQYNPLWTTWALHFVILKRLKKDKPDDYLGQHIAEKIIALKTSHFYQHTAPACLAKIAYFFAKFSFMSSIQDLFPEKILFIAHDLSRTIDGINTFVLENFKPLDQAQKIIIHFLSSRFLKPLIHNFSTVTFGNTWTQIIAAVTLSTPIADIQNTLARIVQALPRDPTYAYALGMTSSTTIVGRAARAAATIRVTHHPANTMTLATPLIDNDTFEGFEILSKARDVTEEGRPKRPSRKPSTQAVDVTIARDFRGPGHDIKDALGVGLPGAPGF